MVDITPLSHKLFDYVEQSSGWFYTDDIYKSLSITIERDKTNIRVQLHALCAKGLLERDPRVNVTCPQSRYHCLLSSPG